MTKAGRTARAYLLLSFASLLGSASSVAQQGNPSVLNPTTNEDCQRLSREWQARTRNLELANTACERRAGPPSSIGKGVWLPNCQRLQQIYITCGSEADQVCAAREQRNEAFATCGRQVSASQKSEQDKGSRTARIEREAQGLKSAIDTMTGVGEKGPTGYLVDRYLATPETASSRFHDAVKEAARTTGTSGADSEPTLNRVGEASDKAFRTAPLNPIATEVGSQSAAAARARMGDALNQFNGALNQFSPTGSTRFPGRATPAPVPFRGIDRSADSSEQAAELSEELRQEQIERSNAAARLEMMRQMNEAAQRTLRQMTSPALQGGTTNNPGTSPRSGPARQGPDCRSREMVCSAGQPCKRRCTAEEERSFGPKD